MNAERTREAEHLVLAERHLLEGERRIGDQVLLLGRMRDKGHDTMQAELLLRTFEATLLDWRTHRNVILDRIQQLDARPG
jgi:hypothetical protein